MSFISVVIPTYNRQAMLAEAVDSVRGQTYPAHRREIIVVDDGSTDGTSNWLASQSDVICLRHENRRGPSAARNLGARHAQGDYLAFLDSDDLFLPEKLTRQAALLDHHPHLALVHSNEIWRRGHGILRQKAHHEKRGGYIFEHCLPLCRISPSAAMIRREIFTSLGGFAEELEVAEDYEFWLRLCCQHEVGFIDEPLIIKRGGHDDQLSMKYGQIEKFRIAALQRVLKHAPLDDTQRTAALNTLASKCEIYAQGCQKRGRAQEALEFFALAAQYREKI